MISSWTWPWLQSFACALLLTAASTLASEPISVAETRTLAPAASANAATHDLSLDLYRFRGSRWEPETIAAAITDAAGLLASCGIALTQVRLHTIVAPRRFHFFHTPASRALVSSIEVRRPAIFFVEDTLNRPAFDAEAIALANARTRPELANTIWVAYGARDLPYAVAHELVHVLSDSGEHSAEPGNLMRPETDPGNSTLSPPQCERLRTKGAANDLLKPRSSGR